MVEELKNIYLLLYIPKKILKRRLKKSFVFENSVDIQKHLLNHNTYSNRSRFGPVNL